MKWNAPFTWWSQWQWPHGASWQSGYLFAPLFVLVKGRPGFFNALLPLGTALSGFLYPISQLSSEAQIVAHILPTSWAMDGVIRSVREGESAARIVRRLGSRNRVVAGFYGLYFFHVSQGRRKPQAQRKCGQVLRWERRLKNLSLQSYYSYKGLFLWLNWPAYISNVFIAPVILVVMLTLTGKFAGASESGDSYILGVATYGIASILCGGILQSFFYERAFGTLSMIYASRSNRWLSYWSKGAVALPQRDSSQPPPPYSSGGCCLIWTFPRQTGRRWCFCLRS